MGRRSSKRGSMSSRKVGFPLQSYWGGFPRQPHCKLYIGIYYLKLICNIPYVDFNELIMTSFAIVWIKGQVLFVSANFNMI